jgi:DNA-binding winged helix-turn-helix (wHTH) protein
VRLGSRALDILCVLVSAEGRVVTKDELMARVWAGVVVEEHNIQVHISALRRTFEEDRDGGSWIVTVPGRGYRLLLPREPPTADDPAPGWSSPVTDNPSLAVLPFVNLSRSGSRRLDRRAGGQVRRRFQRGAPSATAALREQAARARISTIQPALGHRSRRRRPRS